MPCEDSDRDRSDLMLATNRPSPGRSGTVQIDSAAINLSAEDFAAAIRILRRVDGSATSRLSLPGAARWAPCHARLSRTCSQLHRVCLTITESTRIWLWSTAAAAGVALEPPRPRAEPSPVYSSGCTKRIGLVGGPSARRAGSGGEELSSKDGR